VLLHQTIIGQEIKKQMEMADAYPDVVYGCIGGGSSFGGMVLPFIKDKVEGKNVRLVAVEPEACPTVTKGLYAYDFGDEAGMTPLLHMHTLGHTFVPPPVHAGGLRYHGMAPIICHLHRLGLIEAQSEHQVPVFKAAVEFARTEGIIPAPEPSHAIKATIDEAIRCRESGEAKTILFLLCGHGHFDMAAYDAYLSGKLEDYEYPEDKVKEALTHLPKVG
jgi:tryptophan synthase beta chain